MTTEEHLLVCLSEECAEIQKEISKALRFGLDHNWPNGDATNREKIAIELIDLSAVRRLLEEEGILKRLPEAGQRIAAKRLKIYEHIGKAVKLGRIQLPPR